MPENPDENTRFAEADKYVSQFDLTLERVTKDYQKKGGEAFHLLQSSEKYVVQLCITTDKDDPTPDLHCVAYDGETVRDNYRYSKVKVLDASDRETPENARGVFNS
eukprot:2596097-Prymnesium_polylepis.1